MQLAADLLDATIDTRIAVLPSGAPDYQCAIIDTQRVHNDASLVDAEQLLGPGYFVLNVAVVQQVWIAPASSTAVPLTDEQLASVVETGFGRGAGGRVRFRSLLQDHPDFQTIIYNVEVLSQGWSTSAGPTMAPSSSPPSMQPSGAPTLMPSTASPVVTTSRPTLRPTFMVTTDTPTPFPTHNGPTSVESDNRQTVVLGVLAGGLLAILTGLCLLCCHCRRRTRDDESTQAPPDNAAESGSSSDDNVAGQLIPGVVNVSQNEHGDGLSLAESTLGPPAAALPLTKQPRLHEAGSTTTATTSSSETKRQSTAISGQVDSFDDESLYTSLSVPDKTQTMVITKLLPTDLHNTLDFEDDILFPMSGSVSESESEEHMKDQSSGPATPISESTRRASNLVGDFENDDDGSSFLPTSDEEKARARSMINTKGFDPFADDSSGSSSFTFGNVEPVENPIFGRRSYSHDDRSSPSNTTTSTNDAEQLLVGTMRTVEEHTAGDLIVHNDLSDAAPKSKMVKYRDRALSDDQKTNNKLLRSFLEDARSLADSKTSAARSRASRQSAPSRFHNYRKGMRTSGAKDLLADHLDLHAGKPRRGRSSMSVGAPPLPRAAKDTGDTRPRRPGKESPGKDGNVSNDSSSPTYRSRYLENLFKTRSPSPALLPPSPRPQTRSNKVAVVTVNSSDSEDDALLEAAHAKPPPPLSPCSTSTVPPSPTGHLGAHPRSDSIPSEDSVMHVDSESTGLPDTPASSPGLLGISEKGTGRMLKEDSSIDSDGLSNPWLFDVVEQTLGPRSSNADMESISGRSSRSGRSQKSGGRSHTRSRSLPRGRPRECSTNRSCSSSTRSRGEPLLAANKSSEMALEPKNLENDLRRLQLQIADVLQSEMDQVPGSNISVSTVSEGAAEQSKQLKKKKRQKTVVVVVPPGKLGIVLANRHDGKGTVVEKVPGSLNGMVAPLDKIVAVDEQDVTDMTVKEICDICASRASSERRLTFVKTVYTSD